MLFAISSLVRGNSKGRQIFFKEDGVEALNKAFLHSFGSDDVRAASRAIIVSYHIYHDGLDAGDKNANDSFKNILDKMKEKIQSKSNDYAQPLDYIKTFSS